MNTALPAKYPPVFVIPARTDEQQGARAPDKPDSARQLVLGLLFGVVFGFLQQETMADQAMIQMTMPATAVKLEDQPDAEVARLRSSRSKRPPVTIREQRISADTCMSHPGSVVFL